MRQTASKPFSAIRGTGQAGGMTTDRAVPCQKSAPGVCCSSRLRASAWERCVFDDAVIESASFGAGRVMSEYVGLQLQRSQDLYVPGSLRTVRRLRFRERGH